MRAFDHLTKVLHKVAADPREMPIIYLEDSRGQRPAASGGEQVTSPPPVSSRCHPATWGGTFSSESSRNLGPCLVAMQVSFT